MPANSFVRTRIDETIKQEAAAVLEEMGLTVSDATRILLTRIAKEKRFPLELIPNALTAETLNKSERREDVHKAKDADDLFTQLGI